jgi:hypothetical protein
LGIFPQAVSSCPILGKGVDVGIKPKAGHRNAIIAQIFHALIAAGGAADMKQRFHKNSSQDHIFLTITQNWRHRNILFIS